MMNLLELIEKGGLVTYPLILCSIVSLSVIMEKLWGLRGIVPSTEEGRRVSEQGLQKALEKELAKSTDKTVIFEGDKNVLLGEAVKVLDMAKKAGAEKISIAAEKAAASP